MKILLCVVMSIYINSSKVIKNIKKINYSGSGWYGGYYIGAYSALEKIKYNMNDCSFVGASFGSLIATSCAAKIKSKTIYDYMLDLHQRLNSNKNDKHFSHFITDYYNKIIHPNIDKINFEKLQIKISKIQCHQIINHKYKLNKYNLLESLISSCHIPYYTYNSLFHKKNKLDGFLTNLIPNIDDDKNNTLYLGIRGENYDISYDKFKNRKYNMMHILYPMTTDDFIETYNLGYDDTIEYFKCNKN